jgi:restriction system protein
MAADAVMICCRKREPHGGVDGVINEDRLGLHRIYVQAKRYAPANTIGCPDVQAFVGSLAGHHASGACL